MTAHHLPEEEDVQQVEKMGKLKFQKMKPKTKEGFKKTGKFMLKYGGTGPVGLAKMAAGGVYESRKKRKEKNKS